MSRLEGDRVVALHPGSVHRRQDLPPLFLHDGAVQKAIELVTMAAACGAEAVKVQVFRAVTLLHGSSMLAEYQKQRGKAESPLELLRRYELSAEDMRKIVQRARELKLVPLAT